MPLNAAAHKRGPAASIIERKARMTLEDDGYDAAVRTGEALSRDEAIELALSPIEKASPEKQASRKGVGASGRGSSPDPLLGEYVVAAGIPRGLALP